MKEIKLNLTKQTGVIALALFTLYFVYGLFKIPVVQYLVSLAVGGLAYGISGSYEVATIALIATHLVYPILGGPAATGPKGYSATGTSEGFMNVNNVQDIVSRVSSMRNPLANVKGVGSKTTEGFEDAGVTDMTVSETKSGSSQNTQDVSATSKPAPTETEQASTASKKKEETPAPAPAKISEQGVPPANQPSAPETFQDNGSLFKLGTIPTDGKGGFHIDSGTTIMNALKALKPEQIQGMTADTKQLIETQKSLMQMLQTFQPMVKEGKEMMETFQSMFGTGGAMPSA